MSRKERREQFLASGAFLGSFAVNLINCARSEQERVFEDCRKDVTRKVHASDHAAGTVILLCCAVDVFFNETITRLCMHGPLTKEQGRQLVDLENASEKYGKILEVAFGTILQPTEDFRLVGEVRNEFAHYTPRPISARTGQYPSWFEPLRSRGLVIFGEQPGLDYTVDHICSCRVGSWAWKTVYSCLEQFCSIDPEKLRKDWLRYFSPPTVNCGAEL